MSPSAFAPVSCSEAAIRVRNRSVSKTLVCPCSTVVMRSSPMPVSIEGLGRGLRAPSDCWSNCMNTRFQISTKRSPSSSGDPGGPPAIAGPWSKKISEQGPQGPVSPMDQKLSVVAMRMIRSSGRPAIFFQRPAASSSSA